MRPVLELVARVGPSDANVLITGENGTGKGLVAQALHGVSQRADRPFISVNMGGLPEGVFESELFGHVRGAFTGAANDKAGLFEHAHGGALFLDEIGDMPLATQAKLLRVLQNQEVQRVGSLTARKVDVRVVAATNQNLRAAVAEKRFREDLYYRLSMVEIDVPRLAERKEDLPLLERHFVARFAAQFKKDIRGLTHRAQVRLSLHGWPGNIRELENVLGHASMMAMGDTIDVQDLPAYLRFPAGHEDTMQTVPSSADTGNTLAEQERMLIIRALETAGGNQSQAARILRIGRDALRYKLKKHNLEGAIQSK
jgi:DNA-binding NtrC family response regulator